MIGLGALQSESFTGNIWPKADRLDLGTGASKRTPPTSKGGRRGGLASDGGGPGYSGEFHGCLLCTSGCRANFKQGGAKRTQLVPM